MIEILRNRIDELAELRGLTRRQISIAANGGDESNDSLLKNWFRKSTKTMPRMDSIKRVADVLDCDVQYLMGEQDVVRSNVTVRSTPVPLPCKIRRLSALDINARSTKSSTIFKASSKRIPLISSLL